MEPIIVIRIMVIYVAVLIYFINLFRTEEEKEVFQRGKIAKRNFDHPELTDYYNKLPRCPRCDSVDIYLGDGHDWQGENAPKVPEGIMYCKSCVYCGLNSEFYWWR